MSRIITVMLVVLLAQLVLPPQASADVGVSVVFSQDEISIISTWYNEQKPSSGKSEGRKKPKGLPPGIARNLARGKALPPGIAKRYLPDELRHALPSPPTGYERIVIDGKVLLVEIATRVIHDILVDVVLN